MKTRGRCLALIMILLLPLPFLLPGCSSGGGDGGDSDSDAIASIDVRPTGYSFGVVTPGNSPAPLEVEISNTGSAALTVQDTLLTSDATVPQGTFDLHLDVNPVTGEPYTCVTPSSVIDPGENCTLGISFRPPGSDGTYDGTLTLYSNDPRTPILDVPLDGTTAPVSDLFVRINQVPCPHDEPIAVYVSVTDQAGYPYTGLASSNFTAIEDVEGEPPVSYGTLTGNLRAAIPAVRIESEPISVALVMDYSSSITGIEDAVQDMEDSVITFIEQMGSFDEAEIIKFNDTVDRVRLFTLGTSAGKSALETAVEAEYDDDQGTALYDAVQQAVSDLINESSNPRKAVIVITDGEDTSSSNNEYGDVILAASNNDIPIFTVGVGNIQTILQNMAEETGGQDYAASTSDNLRTVYQQLSDVLYLNYYLLTYDGSNIPSESSVDLTVQVDWTPPAGSPSRWSHTKTILACP